jgi:hypothetical protein
VREDRSTAGQSWTRRDVKRWAEGAPGSVAKTVVEVRDGKRGPTARQPPLPFELSSLAGRPPPPGFQPPRAAGQRHPAKERKSARLCASTRFWAAVLQAMGEGRQGRGQVAASRWRRSDRLCQRSQPRLQVGGPHAAPGPTGRTAHLSNCRSQQRGGEEEDPL